MLCDFVNRITVILWFLFFPSSLNVVLHFSQSFIKVSVIFDVVELRHNVMVFGLINVPEPFINLRNHFRFPIFQGHSSCSVYSALSTYSNNLSSFSTANNSPSIITTFTILFFCFCCHTLSSLLLSSLFMSCYCLTIFIFLSNSAFFTFVFAILLSIDLFGLWLFISWKGEVIIIKWFLTFLIFFNHFSSNFCCSSAFLNSWSSHPNSLKCEVYLWLVLSILELFNQLVVVVNTDLIEIVNRIFGIQRMTDRHES